MTILILNCGSSSLKFSLVELPNYRTLTSGLIERVGTDGAVISFKKKDGEKEVQHPSVKDHTEGVSVILKVLTDPEFGFLKSLDEINAVGHRVVHGGETFTQSVAINSEVIEALKANIPLAPLHNPANIAGIEAATKVLGDKIPQVAVFDTAFHQTMPEEAFMYGLPYEFYERYGVRRYGFHGTSHDYVSHKAAEFLGIDYQNVRMITAHVGSGASISAIKGGKCIETSMGLTPGEGLLMGTRAGDLDTGIVNFLLNKTDYKPEEIEDYVQDTEAKGKRTNLELEDLDFILNKRSGIYGIGGIGSSDGRDLDAAAQEGNKRAKLAMEMMGYRVKKYIGSYAAVLGGLDVLVFTAGMGENRSALRTDSCRGLEFLGIELDEEMNQKIHGETAVISTPNSKVKVVIIPTDEEYMIAKDTYEILSK